MARFLSYALGLNQDLTEAIACGHDVGHAPFGHAGERQIDDFLNGFVPLPREVWERIENQEAYRKAFSGELSRDFRHNFQSVRLLSIIEKYSPSERGQGLNLTYQTLAGMLKHTKVSSIRDKAIMARYPDARHISYKALIEEPTYQSIETQIVAIADEIAQVVHDLCDAMKQSVISLDDLRAKHSSTASIIAKCMKCATSMDKEVDFSLTAESDELVAQACSILVNYFITNTVETIAKILDTQQSVCPETVVELCNTIGSTPYPVKEFNVLMRFKNDLIVNNFNVNRMDNRGRYMIRQLIKSYLSDPRQLPDWVLNTFMEMKRAELRLLGKDHFRSWFEGVPAKFKIKKMENKHIDSVITIVDEESQGNSMRHAPHELLNALVPFLVCDSDYLRAVADYISSMSDRYAEKECAAMYD